MEDKNDFPIELTNATGTCLQDLNDHCLLAIFESRSLDIMDLCSLAETCKRFQSIVRKTLPKDINFTHMGCGGEYVFKSKRCKLGRYRREKDAKRIFKEFGSSIVSIHISTDCTHVVWKRIDFLIDSIARHCDNLKNLSFNNCSIMSYVQAVKLKPVFKRLEKLTLREVSLIGDPQLYAGMDSMVELTLYDVQNCSAILENNLPKLETLQYVADHLPMSNFASLISRYSNLKNVVFDYRRDCCYSYVDKRISVTYLQSMQTLKSLRNLSLSNVSFEDLSFFSTLTELRVVKLADCILPMTNSSQFSSLQQITKLYITGTEIRDIPGVIGELKNLEEFTVFDGHVILYKYDFVEIMRIVNNRPQVLTIKCVFDFKVKPYVDNQKVRLFPLYR